MALPNAESAMGADGVSGMAVLLHAAAKHEVITAEAGLS